MNYKEIARTALRDRGYLVALAALALISIISVVLMITMIEPVDLQVTVRYSSFGITKFYRDKWYYLLGFIAMILITFAINAMLSLKLYDLKGRDMARLFLVLTAVIVIIGTVSLYGVLRVASLSQ